jgi:hypothetical protein
MVGGGDGGYGGGVGVGGIDTTSEPARKLRHRAEGWWSPPLGHLAGYLAGFQMAGAVTCAGQAGRVGTGSQLPLHCPPAAPAVATVRAATAA